MCTAIWATTARMGEAPRFKLHSPCTAIKWLLFAAVTGVGGAILLQYLLRPKDVDPLEPERWLKFDGYFVLYAFISFAISIFVVTVIRLLYSGLVYGAKRTCHCIFCCPCCRGRPASRDAVPPTTSASSRPWAPPSASRVPVSRSPAYARMYDLPGADSPV